MSRQQRCLRRLTSVRVTSRDEISHGGRMDDYTASVKLRYRLIIHKISLQNHADNSTRGI